MTPEQLASWAQGRWADADARPDRVDGFCFDARQLRSGAAECFVALSGGARDGHEFVAQATEKGAVAVIVERPVPVGIPQLVVADSLQAMGRIGAAVRREFVGPVVAVTGSCGKTSTKEMLRLLLGEGRTHATAGNWNNRIGVPMTLFGLDAATHDFAVIEAGINQPGEMAELGTMIRADATVVTNIEAAHLELLGSTETVADEKSQLVRLAVENSPVFLTGGAFRFDAFASLAERAVVLVGEGESVAGDPVSVVGFRLEPLDAEATRLSVFQDGDVCTFTVHSRSHGICQNAALAILVARHLGVDLESIQRRIARWRPTAKRGQIVVAGAQSFYVDCYNANPASMLDAIETFAKIAPSQQARCYVIGAMNELGEGARGLHQRIGGALRLRSEDEVVFVGPPVLAEAYAAGALSAGVKKSQLRTVESVDAVKAFVAKFEGAIFLKGSRSYALEKLLPESFQ